MGAGTLGFLEHVNVLRDALHIGVVTEHLSWEVDEFAWVEATTVGVEMVKQLFCHDVGVERSRVMEVVVPEFANDIADELGCGAFGGSEGSLVAEEDCMGGFVSCTDNCRGIIGDGGG